MGVVHNYPRAFAYTTGCFMIGVLLYVLTNLFYPFLARPDYAGSVVLLGYALIYLNLNWGLARRFVKKTATWHAYSYVLAGLMAVSTMVMALIKEDFADPATQGVFFVIIGLASLIGARLGIRSGRKYREEIMRERQQADIDPALKRSHEHISKN